MQRLQKGAMPQGLDFYYLDLITYRTLSKAVAQRFDVAHESPQILVIRNGACVYDESHLGISMSDIAEQAAAA